MGSSRRNKGRQHAKEEATENTRDDEASKTPNISLAIETARQEELTDIKSPEKIRKVSSTVNEDENTEKLPNKDTFFTDSSTVMTADNDVLKSNKDVDDKDKKLVKEPENLTGDPRGTGLRSDSYHVVMIGDSSVGKTSFMKRAQTGKFSLDIPSSIGLDSCMWTVVVDGKPVVLELWDTAGQERFRSITRHIFHKAQAFLLMYDITCTESFSAVSYWANCIQESGTEDVTVLLLGNKSDCAKRQVKTEQGEILAKEYNFEFMECSAATGENVVQCLETVARMLNQKIGAREEATVVQQEAGQKKRSTCC
uniref:RAB44, member RAS oncogene family n=1 Tax=Amphiprion percula TaxID=161767 RepID=A0A3P8T1D5_AMPPE